MAELCQKCGIEAVEDNVCMYCGAGKAEGADAEDFKGDAAPKEYEVSGYTDEDVAKAEAAPKRKRAAGGKKK